MSLRTAPLALNAQSQQKLSTSHADAGVLHISKAHSCKACLIMQRRCAQPMHENPSTASIKTTFRAHARDAGGMTILWHSQDRLQLPPVPDMSSMLAPLEGTSDEHKVGANIFRDAELVFEFSSAMCFTDGTLIQILEAMRTAGGRQISHVQGQALVVTEGRAVQPADASSGRPDESSCYHACC